MQIILDVSSLVEQSVWQLSLYLLLYWNMFTIFTHVFLALWWVVLAAQVLRFAEGVSKLVETATLPPNGRSMGFDNENGQIMTFLEIALCSFYAHEAMEQWRAALVTRLVLNVWVRRLSLWPTVWEYCSPLRRVGVGVVAMILGAACALQWAYYATLPLPTGAESSDARVSFIWYLLVMSGASLFTHCAVVLVSVAMHAVGFPLLVAVVQKMRLCPPRRLVGSAFDPSSDEFKLVMQYAMATLMAIVGWSYAPEDMPVVFQVLVLARLLDVFGAMSKLRTYRQILLGFPDVAASAQDRCGICLEDFVASETVKRLACGHCFHGPCLREWLLQHPECPLCRQPTSPPPPGLATADEAPAGATAGRHAPWLRQRWALSAGPPAFTGSIAPLVPRLPMRQPPPAAQSEHTSYVNAPPSPSPRQPSYAHLQSIEEVERELAAVSAERQRRQADLFLDEPLLLKLSGATTAPSDATEAGQHRRYRRRRASSDEPGGIQASGDLDSANDTAVVPDHQRPRRE